MKLVLLFTLLALATCAAATVIDVTSDNVDSIIEDNDFVLLMIYAPWGGHCRFMMPSFVEASDVLEGKVVLARLDGTSHPELCKRFGVPGYPTLYFFKWGHKFKYDGKRCVEGIVSWLEARSQPSSLALTTAEDLAAFRANTPAAVGYFADGVLNSKEGKAFDAAAATPNLDSVRFGHVTDEALFGDAATGTVVFYRGADIGDDVTYVAADTEDVAQALYVASLERPLSVPLATAERLAAFRANTPAAVGYFAGGSLETAAGQAFLAAADFRYLKDVRFGHVADESLFGDVAAGTVVFYRGADIGGDVTFDATNTKKNLTHHLFKFMFPAVGNVDVVGKDMYEGLGQPLFLAYVDPDDEASKVTAIAALMAAQVEHTDAMFAYTRYPMYRDMEEWGNGFVEEVPCIILLDFASNEHIVLEEDITLRAVVAWVSAVIDGSVRYVPKSARLPKDNKGPVKLVVRYLFGFIVKEWARTWWWWWLCFTLQGALVLWVAVLVCMGGRDS